MSVRRCTARHSNVNVFFTHKGNFYSLYRADTFTQNKSSLYYLKKRIIEGKVTLPENADAFTLEVDGTVRPGYPTF